MATQLINSMTSQWDPSGYHDQFRERLSAIIQKRIKATGATTQIEEPAQHEDATTNVVDFMSLLQKSLETNKRTPAKSIPVKTASGSGEKVIKKPAAKKASKNTAVKKAPAKKAARKSA
jgi:DNA end-binding protein Ku